MVSKEEIQRLSKDAVALQRQHLIDIIADAEQKDDSTCAKVILDILQWEAHKKQWRQINYSTCSPWGDNLLAI